MFQSFINYFSTSNFHLKEMISTKFKMFRKNRKTNNLIIAIYKDFGWKIKGRPCCDFPLYIKKSKSNLKILQGHMNVSKIIGVANEINNMIDIIKARIWLFDANWWKMCSFVIPCKEMPTLGTMVLLDMDSNLLRLNSKIKERFQLNNWTTYAEQICPNYQYFHHWRTNLLLHDHKVIIVPNGVFILLILGLPIGFNRLDLCFIHDFLHLNLFRYVPKLKTIKFVV